MINKHFTIACLTIVLCLFGTFSANASKSKWLECPQLNDAASYDKDSLKYLVPGDKNWVFISKKDFIEEYKLRQSAVMAYKNFQKALAEKGTELVLVVIPPRGLVHDEKIDFNHTLTKDYDIKNARQDFSNVLQQLERAGLAIALAPDFESIDDYGHATDHHFNSTGAKIIAQETAEAIKTLPVYKKISKKNFVVEEGDNINFKGTFFRPIKQICGHELTPMTVKKQVTVAEEDELFEDSKADITLVGTSFSVPGSSKSNFVGQLRVVLSANIDNRSIGGGGVKKSLGTYLNSEDFKNNPPKILIWEIPGFYHLNREKFLEEAIEMVKQNG